MPNSSRALGVDADHPSGPTHFDVGGADALAGAVAFDSIVLEQNDEWGGAASA